MSWIGKVPEARERFMVLVKIVAVHCLRRDVGMGSRSERVRWLRDDFRNFMSSCIRQNYWVSETIQLSAFEVSMWHSHALRALCCVLVQPGILLVIGLHTSRSKIIRYIYIDILVTVTLLIASIPEKMLCKDNLLAVEYYFSSLFVSFQ